jgi:purine-binding chemotaxis protein CheW
LADGDLSLICRVLNRICALPLQHVIETMRPLPVQSIEGAPRSVMGVAIIRGAPVPVVDLGWVLAGAESQPTRFVTIDADGRRVALAVDAVIGTRMIPRGSLYDLPPLLQDANADAITAIGRLDAELLVMLGSGRVIPETVWDGLEAGGSAP